MENKEVLNFDPNLTLCGRTVNQEVRLTFAQWDYQLTETVTVGGNCTGRCRRDGVFQFAGWADSLNIQPFIKAFMKWCDILSIPPGDVVF